MSELKNTDPVEKLLQLQQKFKNQLPEKLACIESAWLTVLDEKSPNFTDFHLQVHSIVGAAGTFGASMLSTVARTLESQIKLLINKSLILDDNIIEQIEYLLLEVKTISENWQLSSIPLIPEIKEISHKINANWKANVYLVEDDVEVANMMISFLEESGYDVFYYRQIKEFEKEYGSHERASAIIMDMSFNEGIIAGAETIQRLSDEDQAFPPVIFISVHNDIQARLAAAQAGAKRYFTKPIDKSKLLSSLDKLTHRTEEDAYRILLIDDEKDVLDYNSMILEKSGMEVLSFTNPIEGYRCIEKYKPELIVLDLYMEECSGFDLARVIRQDDEYSSIPIVFLSSELDVSTQLSAMDLGGDDFLSKPVSEEHFVQKITSRVKRTRRVNTLNKKVKNALRESEFRLVTLDQHAIMSMTDVSGRITFANQHFFDISGYSEEELVGKNHRLLKSGRHPEKFYDDMWKTISNGKIWNGQVCNKTKYGEEYWVESTIVPFMDENNIPYKYVSVRTDITKIKKSEVAASESEKRLLRQRESLNTLSTITDYILLEADSFFNIVTQRATEILNVDRVSIWMMGNEKAEIKCEKLFEQNNHSWSNGAILKKDVYPKYFSALEKNTTILISDAHTHPATSEFSADYLTPLGIGAMLDVPIRRQGELIGVLCCEHVGTMREWHIDEESFIVGLSDLISLNLESSERKKMEKKLSKAKESADKANKAKSDFLSSMSHELRTPLNAISGFAQLIVLDEQNNKEKETCSNAKEILKAGDHLIELINQVLNLAEIESRKVKLLIENVSFSDVVLECFSLTSSMIESRNISLSYKLNGENVLLKDLFEHNVFIHSDRMRLKQVLLNLLSNAVKYNKDNGSVMVACDVSESIVRISVIDTGKGISEEGLKKLFQSFSRLGEENSNIEGTGIGLVITKDLVELMQGDIGVESEVGVGSTFWFELPKAQNKY